jgi:hypothetical protein
MRLLSFVSSTACHCTHTRVSAQSHSLTEPHTTHSITHPPHDASHALHAAHDCVRQSVSHGRVLQYRLSDKLSLHGMPPPLACACVVCKSVHAHNAS